MSQNQPHLTLWYIDVRPLLPSSNSPNSSDSPNPKPSFQSAPPYLPLLSTLPPETRSAILRFLRPTDQMMSLASALLKTLLIHRLTGTAWEDVRISRTPAPHGRPFWDPRSVQREGENEGPGSVKAIEFNISHQAGLVVLAGLITDTVPNGVLTIKNGPGDLLTRSRNSEEQRLGIDVTCMNEPGRGTGADGTIKTDAEFNEWVDVFSEVFSEGEMGDMKTFQPPLEKEIEGTEAGEGNWAAALVRVKLRRFYSFFALKEAYIKMTGEALLAGWLKELEFRNVKAPGQAEEGQWGEVETGAEVWFRREPLGGLVVEVVGFGTNFIVALVGKGLGDRGNSGPYLGEGMDEIDIKRDIKGCVDGSCRHTNTQSVLSKRSEINKNIDP